MTGVFHYQAQSPHKLHKLSLPVVPALRTGVRKTRYSRSSLAAEQVVSKSCGRTFAPEGILSPTDNTAEAVVGVVQTLPFHVKGLILF